MAGLPVIDLGVDYDADSALLGELLQKSTRLGAGERQWRAPRAADDEDEGEDELDELDDPDVADEAAAALDGMDLDGADGRIRFKYKEQLQRIANREQSKLVIDLADIARHQDTATDLVSRIQNNARRYVDMLSVEVDKALPPPTRDLSTKDDVIDVIIHQRQEKNAANADADLAQFPPRLIRRYDLYLRPMARDPVLAVREVRGAHMGKLITVRGIVTRVSEVKPKLLVNAFSCDACDSEVFQDVEERSFMPLTDCPSEDCQRDGSRGKLHMQTRACKFSPFQEVKIQEMADQVPVGHIPRSMTIHLNGTMTRSMSPGDIVHVGGIFLPTPFTSGRSANRIGLLTDTFLEAHHVRQLKKQYEAMQLTPEIQAQLAELQHDEALYNKLASSIAPEIYGHADVKKALLLLLVGGVTKSVGDGMKIRGDINICLMGDPGVAKSQLLKYITKVAPRGVYTTGRGSSGVGLTAAVMRDPVTDEMVLEGGALVLADNGIACIDEFDKMDESDRTAIHEVMEQQTISIAKAGITTTLNARTSILAAANPLYGRYNPKISPVDNINLPAALLSRFDVMFLILDTPTRDDDERLAQHVCHVHMHESAPELDFDVVSPLILRHYVAQARQRRPTVPRAVSEYIVSAYVQLRAASKEDDAANKSFTYTSARTLLAVLRLSQALARLRFADEVEQADVDEALRLMSVSKASLLSDDDADRDQDQTTTSKIYRIIRSMASSAPRPPRGEARLGRGEARDEDAMDEDEDVDEPDADDDGASKQLSLREVKERVQMKGFSLDAIQECLDEYEALDVFIVDETAGTLTFLDG